jgi:tetratricopeptide (TPR) repeat protein
VNYALGGLNPWGYHLFNTVAHVLAGLTLYAVVRRTLPTEPLRSDWNETEDPGNRWMGAGRNRCAGVGDSDDLAQAHYYLGVASWLAGQSRDAILHWERARRIDPNYAEAHYNWGNALAQLGQKQAAAEHYEQALRIKPDFTDARTALDRLQASP